MRLLIALMLLPFLVFGQTTTLDTSYLTIKNGLFFEVHRFEYSDGGHKEDGVLIGDTSQLLAYHTGQFNNQSRNARYFALQTMESDRIWNQMINLDQLLQTTYSISPIATYQRTIDSVFTNNTWQLEDLAGNVVHSLTFSRNSAGKLRVQFGTEARIVHLLEGSMRIPNFPLNNATNFYQVNANTWANADRRLFIRRTSNRLR